MTDNPAPIISKDSKSELADIKAISIDFDGFDQGSHETFIYANGLNQAVFALKCYWLIAIIKC